MLSLNVPARLNAGTLNSPASVREKILELYALLIISKLPLLFKRKNLFGLVADPYAFVTLRKS